MNKYTCDLLHLSVCIIYAALPSTLSFKNLESGKIEFAIFNYATKTTFRQMYLSLLF